MNHIVIMGVCGSGKSTIANLIAKELKRPFAEADEFHPQSNIDKMSSGQPLNDEDRRPWLESIRDWMTTQYQAGKSTIVTCSALKKSYRDILRQAQGQVLFVLPHGDKSLLLERMQGREGHFMPVSLLDSQLETLEMPNPKNNVLIVDIKQTPQAIANNIITHVQ